MNAPQRIQRKRTRGWRMPEGAVYVGRPTEWGNPWTVGVEVQVSMGGEIAVITLTAAMAVDCFRDLMEGRLSYQGIHHPEDRCYVDGWHEALSRLAGRDLVCWCPLEDERGRVPCHADVLLELANPGLVVP